MDEGHAAEPRRNHGGGDTVHPFMQARPCQRGLAMHGLGMAQSVAAALAASKGETELAQAIVNLDDDIIRRINAGDW
jgi:hypothetical protein